MHTDEIKYKLNSEYCILWSQNRHFKVMWWLDITDIWLQKVEITAKSPVLLDFFPFFFPIFRTQSIDYLKLLFQNIHNFWYRFYQSGSLLCWRRGGGGIALLRTKLYALLGNLSPIMAGYRGPILPIWKFNLPPLLFYLICSPIIIINIDNSIS